MASKSNFQQAKEEARAQGVKVGHPEWWSGTLIVPTKWTKDGDWKPVGIDRFLKAFAKGGSK